MKISTFSGFYPEKVTSIENTGWPDYNSGGFGEVTERLKVPVSKTGSVLASTWVRIPPSPLYRIVYDSTHRDS
jgi:hypothetical protein